MDLTRILWDAWILQSYHSTSLISSLRQFSQQGTTTGDLSCKFLQVQLWVLPCGWYYTRWGTFVRLISKPQGMKKHHFHNGQESVRKYVDSLLEFCNPNMLSSKDRLDFGTKYEMYIITSCVILHNIINENQHGQDSDYATYDLLRIPVRSFHVQDQLYRFLDVYDEIRDADTQGELQKDVMEDW